jgi:DNA polymerase-3 subunit chi
MTNIRFYHLEKQSLDQALPALLTKIYSTGKRIVIKTKDTAEAQRLSEILWTFRPDVFLPHGTSKDGHAESQPIWLTDSDENPNGADVLILTHNVESEQIGDFGICCEMLDGRNDEHVSQARTRWKAYKDKGYDVTYWKQGDKGWENKAEKS